MHNKILSSILMCFILFINANAATLNSPVGSWVTISDKTHQPGSIVNIYAQNGKLYGKIVQILPGSGGKPTDVCDKCEGDLKGQPVQGMRFLWDFVPKGNNTWGDGQILDPKTGDVYKATMTLAEDGKQLQVRGYWGFFYRTQTWLRK